MGGMGAEDTNFHADVYRRMGYAEVVDDVTRLFRTIGRTRPPRSIPDELVDDAAIVGNLDYVRKQITVWEAAGVTMMVVSARSTSSRSASWPRSCDCLRAALKSASAVPAVTIPRRSRSRAPGFAEASFRTLARTRHQRPLRQAQRRKLLGVGVVAEAQPCAAEARPHAGYPHLPGDFAGGSLAWL